MKSLTQMQQAFIENFSQTGNAKQSAIKAGYSEATAEQQAHNLKKQLSHEIDEATKKLMSSHVPLAVDKLKDLILGNLFEGYKKPIISKKYLRNVESKLFMPIHGKA